MKVSGEPGKGKWPLRNIKEGTIYCMWDGVRRAMILLEAPNGNIYGVNREAVARGTYPPLATIMVGREESWKGHDKVRQLWVKAGLALWDGDKQAAQKLVDEANRLSREEWSAGQQPDKKEDRQELGRDASTHGERDQVRRPP